MEFCDGGDLAGLLKKETTLPEDIVKDLIQQLGICQRRQLLL
jgi:hypothetical protein